MGQAPKEKGPTRAAEWDHAIRTKIRRQAGRWPAEEEDSAAERAAEQEWAGPEGNPL
jgi:hypothetical protein